MFKPLLPALMPLLLTAAPASAQDVPRAKEVTIPLLGSGNVRTFEPTRASDGVYIQSYRGDWYLARFFTRCLDLPFAPAIGFKTFSSLSLDRGDTILVGRERCQISSIVRSGPPPKRAKKPRKR